ncbi:MAG TPA: hypothetical protein VKU19_14415 [Bryobacteraceae bacterium]|nr:hypothetical protein [Bryobacteraceae bacterium]
MLPHENEIRFGFPSRDLSVKPFGQEVHDKFITARYDSEETALCIVAGASTAAVFHMMRVTEIGVKQLGKHMGLSRVKEVQHPKPGGLLKKPKIRFTPIENCVWEKIQDQLRLKIESRLKGLRPGPSKDKKTSQYGSILADFQGFKIAWRNHVMHGRREFSEPEAFQVLGHVGRFMMSISELL